jgi:hypothetical protein
MRRPISYEDLIALRIHPLAEVMPPMSAADLNRLTDDIQRNGLLTPIILHEGMILDGRHRRSALVRNRQGGWVEDFHPDGDPVDYVFASNIARRHVSASQLAMIAARMVTTSHGRHAGEADVSQADAANRVRVSIRYVRDAIWLMANDATAADNVFAGHLSLAAAMRAARPREETPPDETMHIDPHPPIAAAVSALAPDDITRTIVQILECDPGEWALALPEALRSRVVTKLDDFARRAYDVLEESSLL